MRTEARQRPVEGSGRGDGCDSSQVPKGLEENMALCSDSSVLSGLMASVFSAPVTTGRPALHLQVRD